MKSFVRGVVLGCLLVVGLSAQVVSYQINFRIDKFQYGPVFGESAAPYFFPLTFTFDLTAHPHTTTVRQDATGLGVTTGDWYLFDVESITAISGSFGTQALTLQDVVGNALEVSGEDETFYMPFIFLADSDLTTTPSVISVGFDFPNGSSFQIGLDYDDLSVMRVRAADIDFDSLATGGVLSIEPVSAVPEPSTYALLAGAGALGFTMWRRRREA